MTITDTQILSYYYKDAEPLPSTPISISSITAAEFLLIQSDFPTKANYYPILPRRFQGLGYSPSELPSSLRVKFESKKHSALGRHRTDELILDLNGEMSPVIEFGSLAISEIINHRHGGLFASSISHLPKNLQKKLKSRYRFLLDANVQCLPLTIDVAKVGLNILAEFLTKYEAKLDSRNTVNDALILATALMHSRQLITNDKLLARFAATFFPGEVLVQGSRLTIDFTEPKQSMERKRFHSKGYINRGWQVMERRAARP